MSSRTVGPLPFGWSLASLAFLVASVFGLMQAHYPGWRIGVVGVLVAGTILGNMLPARVRDVALKTWLCIAAVLAIAAVTVLPAQEAVIQSPPRGFGFGNGHLKRDFARCGIAGSPRDRKRSAHSPSVFRAGRRRAWDRDWITSSCAGMTNVGSRKRAYCVAASPPMIRMISVS